MATFVRTCFGAGFLLTFPSLVMAMWATPDLVPVGRIVSNAERYIQEHPEQARGYYVLGRAHSLAFVHRTRVIALWTHRQNEGDVPPIANNTFQYAAESWATENPDQAVAEAELLEHLASSIENFERAIVLDPESDHYHLGLGYVLEEGLPHAHETRIIPSDRDENLELTKEVNDLIADIASGAGSSRVDRLRALLPDAASAIHNHRDDPEASVRQAVRDLLWEHWRHAAIAAYLEAYRLSVDEDLQIDTRPDRGLRTLVAYEAGRGYVRLVKARGIRSDEERDQLVQVEASLKALEEKPRSGLITPIIFSLQKELGLEELLADHLTVDFDLDGDGVVERWPWVAPETAILVWDPGQTGVVTSGRQLFGSVTWWMFPSDGFHALSLLDDDRDQWLRGDELIGLAIWHDRNSNGTSDSGEVTPVSEHGIEAMSTRAVQRDVRALVDPAGLRLQDGRSLPIYDWFVAPAGGQDNP